MKTIWFPLLIANLVLLTVLMCSGAATVKQQIISSQPSWVIRNDQVELAVTKRGAHVAPVTFYRADPKSVRPYYISPWQGENLPLAFCPVLVPLRGDFFCMPFGGNGTTYQGEQHPPHGETAGSLWSLAGVEKKGPVTTLSLQMKTQVRVGQVSRRLSLVEGQNVVYSQTIIEGFSGKTPFAHHAILALPEREGAIRISTSPFKFGMTCPWLFSDPAKGEYQSLAIGATFTDLAKVPTRFKDMPDADCTVFPARRGHADLLQVFEDPSHPSTQPAWVTAVNTQEHWLWFAFKNPQLMPGRVFWIENHGRYGMPWNGRNHCLGIEDGCAFFDKGLAESAEENIINREGIPTCQELKAGQPFVVNYVQGALKVPEGFEQVATVEFKPGAVIFVSRHGLRASATVAHEFVRNGLLPAE
jgi:hypothetical protein